MGLFKSLKKIVAKVVGLDDAANDAARAAAEQVKLLSAGANEDVRKKMAMARGAAVTSRKGGRGARGRDSTIISAGSQIQSRTLLG